MSSKQTIDKVSHIHECIINEMLLNPAVTQQDLSMMFGYSVSWMSRLINSDSFQARLAERRRELIDPVLKVRLEDRLKSAVMQSTEQIQRRLDAGDNADLALQSLGVLTDALGALNPPKK
jgi:hypothetical protein